MDQRKLCINAAMCQEGFFPFPTIYLTCTVKVSDLVKVPGCLLFVEMPATVRLVGKCNCHFLYSTLSEDQADNI